MPRGEEDDLKEKLTPARRLVDSLVFGFGILTLVSVLLTLRWPWVRFVYGVLVGGAGIVLLATGRALPRRFEKDMAAKGAFRLSGAYLIAAAAGTVGLLTFPRTVASVVVLGLAFLVVVTTAVLVRRYPNLSIFVVPNRNGGEIPGAPMDK